MIIPRLLEELEHTLPIASCWLEQPEPLPILMPKVVKERELVAIPEGKKAAIPKKRKLEEDIL